MPKQNEAYRGEDQTLEKIKAKHVHLLVEAGEIPDDQETKDKLWDLACEHVYVEFVKEGLMTTANEVLKHFSKNFKAEPRISDEPAPDGLKLSEVKETHF